jgi:hypothetical protein
MKRYLILVPVLISLPVSTCGKKKSNNASGSSGESVTVAGTLTLPPETPSSTLLPTKIVSIPVVAGASASNPYGLAIGNHDVGGDGSFSVALSKDAQPTLNVAESGNSGDYGSSSIEVSYVLAGFNSSGSADLATRATEAASMTFIGLTSGTSNLINLPVKDAASSNLDLGKTTISGSDARSEHAVSSSYFARSEAELKQLAFLSSSLKGVKNSFINQNGYSSKPYFVWLGGKSAAFSGSFTTAPDVTANGAGFGAYLSTPQATNILLADACDPSKGAGFTFTPPSTITQRTTGNTYTDLTSTGRSGNVQSDGSQGRFACQATDIYIYGQDPSATASTVKVKGFNWGGSNAFVPPVPAGNWTLKYNGETVGIFDLESASVVQGGITKVYLPSVKVTKSGQNIAKVELRFMLYNVDTGTYDVVSDLTTFKKVATSLFLDLTNYANNTKRESHVQIDISSADSNGVFTLDASKFDGTWTESDVSALAVGYEIYGYAMRTEFR